MDTIVKNGMTQPPGLGRWVEPTLAKLNESFYPAWVEDWDELPPLSGEEIVCEWVIPSATVLSFKRAELWLEDVKVADLHVLQEDEGVRIAMNEVDLTPRDPDTCERYDPDEFRIEIE